MAKSQCVMEVEEESLLDQELVQEDRACIEEIEKRGIDEHNVVEILESGLLKRFQAVERDRAFRLQRLAKKALLKKYFQRRVPEKAKKPREPLQKKSEEQANNV